MPGIKGTLNGVGELHGTLAPTEGRLGATLGSKKQLSGSLNKASGVYDYNPLINKPKVEGVTLIGDQTFNDLGLVALSNLEIEDICK